MKVSWNSLKFQRLLFLVLFLIIILIKTYILLVYEVLFYLSFEYLNSNFKYLKINLHKIYNWLFLSFLGFIVLVRADLFNFSDTTDYHINSIEHIFFSGIVCLILLVYNQMFNLIRNKFKVLLLVIFITFNFIGLLNEYFQNFFQHTPIFYLKDNDIKDLVINLIGSSLFVIFSLVFKFKN
jgi:hypothetical protein